MIIGTFSLSDSKPPVWMIVMSGNPISDYYRKLALPSWLKAGFDVNFFEGVTPETYKDHFDLLFGKKHSKSTPDGVMFTVSEKCVWYGHYYLWKKCIDTDTPMIVCEHDIELVMDIQPSIYTTPMACLAHDPPDIRKEKRTSLAGGAYYITPDVAKVLIRINEDRIRINSDGWVWEVCKAHGYFHYDKCSHIKDYSVGFTTKHNKS